MWHYYNEQKMLHYFGSSCNNCYKSVVLHYTMPRYNPLILSVLPEPAGLLRVKLNLSASDSADQRSFQIGQTQVDHKVALLCQYLWLRRCCFLFFINLCFFKFDVTLVAFTSL